MKFTDAELLRLLDCREGCHCPYIGKVMAYRLGVDLSTVMLRLYALEKRGLVSRTKLTDSTEWRPAGDYGTVIAKARVEVSSPEAEVPTPPHGTPQPSSLSRGGRPQALQHQPQP